MLHKQDTWFEKFLACDNSEQNSVLPHADTQANQFQQWWN